MTEYKNYIQQRSNDSKIFRIPHLYDLKRRKVYEYDYSGNFGGD